MDFQQFVDFHKFATESNVAELAPDDDLAPLLFMETRDGVGTVVLIEMNQSTKESIATIVIPTLLRERQAVRGAYICMGWGVIIPEGGTNMTGLIRPSQDPDRHEVVILTAFDATQEKAYVGRIDRDKHTVTWEDAGESSGLFSGFHKHVGA